MERYLFQPNRELLELNAMGMDAGLVHFFTCTYGMDGAHESADFDFVNSEGLTRKIKVNMAEKLLQGRGIKGFFAPYAAYGYLIDAGND